jgi:diguanylate cyclase (GGDEF)-like protein
VRACADSISPLRLPDNVAKAIALRQCPAPVIAFYHNSPLSRRQPSNPIGIHSGSPRKMARNERTVHRIVITEFFARRSRLLVASMAMFLFVAISTVKFFSGPEFVFSAIYLVPIVFTTWCVSVLSGLIMAGASTVVLLFINLSEAHKYLHSIVPYWNAAMDLGVFLIVIFILSEAKHLYQSERELSREDYLTGAKNSRAFYEALANEVIRVRRYPRQITIVYIDLDNFKQVNDRYGHHAGDALLAAVAAVLRSTVREVDVVARLGGDEFALLLPETDADAARLVLNKIETALRENLEEFEPRYDVSFSAGAVTFERPLETTQSMIQYADRVMYSVKQNGKGRIVHEVVA